MVFENNILSSRAKKIEYEVNENECFVCISHTPNDHGHCRTMVDGKRVYIHRLVYEYHNGKIPDEQVVRHKCDNPACINHEHLEIGTQSENIKDRDERLRCKGGKKNLTEEQVISIRNDSRSYVEIARDYNLLPRTISKIKRYETYKQYN